MPIPRADNIGSLLRPPALLAGPQVAFDRDRQGRVTGFRMSAARTHDGGLRRETGAPAQ